jgi:hypothetical protein
MSADTRPPEAIIEGKLWGICDHDELGTTIRITHRASLEDFPKETESVVIRVLGWDHRFPDLHLIEYEHVQYSINYGSSLIHICCEEGPGEICPAVLDALGIYKYHDTTRRCIVPEHLQSHYAEYRSIALNGPYQWLALVIQGNIKAIRTGSLSCASRPTAELSVAIVDMRDSYVKKIGEEAFHSFPMLQHVFFSFNTKSISSKAFFDCPELGDKIAIPRSLRIVARDAFLAKEPVTLEIEDGTPPEARESRTLSFYQQRGVWNFVNVWYTSYIVTGGHDAIAKIRIEEEESKDAAAQSSQCCLML